MGIGPHEHTLRRQDGPDNLDLQQRRRIDCALASDSMTTSINSVSDKCLVENRGVAEAAVGPFREARNDAAELPG